MSDHTSPEWILVRGVVYHLTPRSGRRLGEYDYFRHSVPPDAMPGRRSKWPPIYKSHQKLPNHEIIDATRAREITERALAVLDELMKEIVNGGGAS